MKGYKVMNPDFTCRGYKYEVGKTYTHEGDIEMCNAGFHFCEKPQDCFNYYSFDSNNVVCEVKAEGKVCTGEDKSVTDKITIVRQLGWNEVLNICNTGRGNSGHRNSGHRNSGHRNSGHRNSGDSNSGDRNSGDWNSGDRNSGHSNSGDSNSGHSNSGDSNSGDSNSGHSNSGDWNSGHWNSGDWNSGHWNSANHCSGVFNSKSQPFFMFNKPSEWTYQDWINSEVRHILYGFTLTEWIWWDDMTDEEKKADKDAFVRGGYLKEHDYKEAFSVLWGSLSKEEKSKIKALPNFDPVVFEEITGVKI